MSESSESNESPDEGEIDEGLVRGERPSQSHSLTASACREDDCDGALWYSEHTLVCGVCHTMIDMDKQRRSVSMGDPWEQFQDNRPEYNRSGRKRCVGGFLQAYEWKSSDDVDGAVSELEAELFYS